MIHFTVYMIYTIQVVQVRVEVLVGGLADWLAPITEA